MTVTKKINGIQFTTTSARGSRKETIEDKKAREKVLAKIERYNKTASPDKKFEGFCIGFEIGGVVYAALFDTDTALQRVKAGTKADKILQPLGTQQVRDLAEQGKLDRVCTIKELEGYAQRMKGTNSRDLGTAFQKYLAKESHSTTDTVSSLANGGDKYKGHWEVKFMRLGTSQASCRL